MDDKILDGRPARPLTSRELSKVIGPVILGLAQWNDAEAIEAALLFWVKNFRKSVAMIKRHVFVRGLHAGNYCALCGESDGHPNHQQ